MACTKAKAKAGDKATNHKKSFEIIRNRSKSYFFMIFIENQQKLNFDDVFSL